MEERRPTYDLDAIKDDVRVCRCACYHDVCFAKRHQPWLRSCRVVEVIGGMTRKMFVKSMTTFADHRVWQDVYHVPARDLILYVKFQADVVTEFMIMSFKEK
jgi:motility quorum-sensing regulator/GCU-specific mRNA interferase toxin